SPTLGSTWCRARRCTPPRVGSEDRSGKFVLSAPSYEALDHRVVGAAGGRVADARGQRLDRAPDAALGADGDECVLGVGQHQVGLGLSGHGPSSSFLPISSFLSHTTSNSEELKTTTLGEIWGEGMGARGPRAPVRRSSRARV